MHPTYYIKELSDKAKKDNILDKLINKIKTDFSIIPVIGVEIEFYLQNDDISESPIQIKNEKGKFQYEIDLPPSSDICRYIIEIEKAKILLYNWEKNIDFSPKPHKNDYGNAMHFHVNFLTEQDENFFDNIKNINIAASSLCHHLLQSFLIFAPTENSYDRFDYKFMAPKYICFGGNNRSVAIRTPENGIKRLEHRVSSPLTDAYLAIYAILKAIYIGLKNPHHINIYDKIYGNAFDEQYNLEPFPKNIQIAAKCFNQNILE